jgi:hypothetical protein
MQKSNLLLWWLGCNVCSNCDLYGVLCRRCLRTCHTIVWEIPSSMLTREVDFLGLRSNTPRHTLEMFIWCAWTTSAFTFAYAPFFYEFLYATRKFAYDEAVVCWTVGRIHVAPERWIHTSETAARKKISLVASPFHYKRETTRYSEKQRRCVALTGTFKRASKLWIFSLQLCTECICLTWFELNLLYLLHHFEMPDITDTIL